MSDAAPPTDPVPRPPDALVGSVLAGRFRLIELLDRGGMGKVYRAEQLPLGRICAVKVLDAVDRELARGEATSRLARRFELEAATAAKLAHPNTIRIYDYGVTDDGVYFIAMELLTGVTLQQVIDAEGPLEPQRAIRILRQVCSALSEAHDRGLVHRDLKPANVFLTPHGDDGDFVKVLDFGLVKDLQTDAGVSQVGAVLGSPLYMAPEQIEGSEVDGRTDVYAAGLMLYATLAGRLPFTTTSSLAVMMQQLQRDPPAIGTLVPSVRLPASLEWLVRQAVHKDPDARIPSMAELARGLKLCAAEVRGEVGPIELALFDGRVVAVGDVELPTTSEHRAPTLERATPREEDPVASPAPVAFLAASAVVLVGGGLIAAIGVAAFLATRPAATPPAALVATPEVAAPARLTVELTTRPAGAVVRRGQAMIGVTPLELSLQPDEERELVLEREGFAPSHVLIDGTVRRVEVPLTRLPEAVPDQAAPPPAARVAKPPPTEPPAPTPEQATPPPDEGWDDGIRDPWSSRPR